VSFFISLNINIFLYRILDVFRNLFCRFSPPPENQNFLNIHEKVKVSIFISRYVLYLFFVLLFFIFFFFFFSFLFLIVFFICIFPGVFHKIIHQLAVFASSVFLLLLLFDCFFDDRFDFFIGIPTDSGKKE